MKWLVLLLMFSCATPGRQAFVEHFVGEVFVFKLGKKSPTVRIPILVRRTVDPDAGQIMEELIQPSTTHPGRIQETITNYIAKDTNGLFEVHDPTNTFKGIVKFEGTPWGWEEWSYRIRLKTGSTIKGRGMFEKEGMFTIKYVFDKNGKPIYTLREKLKEVDAVAYKNERKKMVISQARQRMTKPEKRR